jgi:cell division protein FtsN
MDWIRRNWPDLLIGVALVLVIAMIIATLLSGGSLLSLVRRDPPPEPQAVTTLGPETVTEPEPVATAEGAPEEGAGEDAEAEVATPGAGSETAIDPFIPEVGEAQTGGAPLLADAGDDAGADEAPEEGGGEVAEADSNGEGATDASPAPASPTGTYRVAAGAVGSREGADGLAQSYRDLGYTVSVEEQGDLFLLWVGPYDDLEDAEAAAQGIRDAGGDALVYRFAGAAADAAAAAAETSPAVAEDEAEAGATDTAEVGSAAETTTEAATQGATEAATEDAASDDNTAGNTVVDSSVVDSAVVGSAAAGNDAGTAEVDSADNAADADATEDATAETAETTANAGPTDAVEADAEEAETATIANVGASGTEVAAGEVAQGTVALPRAPAGQRYLQVGAFASPASAEGLHQRLESLGFDVTRSETETGLTRLYIGPFEDNELSQTQAALTAQGIDSFPVAQ